MNTPGTPQITLSELDAALAFSTNLLRVLDLAKDVKGLADDARSAMEANEKKAAEVRELLASVSQTREKAQAERANADAQIAEAFLATARVAQGFADLDAERVARQSEREAHDRHAATVREELKQAADKVASDADQLRRRETAIAERETAVSGSLDAARAKLDEAEKLKQHYQAKLDGLRALAG